MGEALNVQLPPPVQSQVPHQERRAKAAAILQKIGPEVAALTLARYALLAREMVPCHALLQYLTGRKADEEDSSTPRPLTQSVSRAVHYLLALEGWVASLVLESAQSDRGAALLILLVQMGDYLVEVRDMSEAAGAIILLWPECALALYPRSCIYSIANGTLFFYLF
tara:strand:+ start:39 stop:539 length:501 start_codon:yes stop_codon:yes gene_type:complete